MKRKFYLTPILRFPLIGYGSVYRYWMKRFLLIGFLGALVGSACGNDSEENSSDGGITDGGIAVLDSSVPDGTVDASVEADAGCVLSMCGDECVDTMNSMNHCGGCESPCSAGENEQAMCTNSVCVLSCTGGFGACGDSTECTTDLSIDSSHCGSCDADCTPGVNETALCTSGACERTCNTNFSDCENEPGCETDTRVSIANCGGCGSACPALPNSDLFCSDSTCGSTCQSGFFDCDNSPGCESTLGNDENCLSCGDSCDSSEECSMAGCVPKHRNVFITSTTHTGNLGGIAGADAICQTRAGVAGLPGSYMAWLSTDVISPNARFTRAAVPYKLPSGVVVASSYADLTDGFLTNSISEDENGVTTTAPSGGFSDPTCSRSFVFSNTLQTGAPLLGIIASCSEFNSASGFGALAEPMATGSRWSNGCGGGSVCSFQSRIYCFQQ